MNLLLSSSSMREDQYLLENGPISYFIWSSASKGGSNPSLDSKVGILRDST
jgi:hypothetical protein